MKIRGFELVKDEFRKHKLTNVMLPKRSTTNSAGYDFFLPESLNIRPGEKIIIHSDVKAYMLPDEVLTLHVRSSVGIKKSIMLSNVTGVIDSDFYSNPENDGNIGIALYNYGNKEVHFDEGEKIIQGIFQKFLKTDDDETTEERVGGIGSTGRV